MKIKIYSILIIILSSLTNQAQITKMESFSTGTKISFYPNECGNEIEEAEGKLSFCDRENNLGVVDVSYGLNDRQVLRMAENYNNEDEVYVTTNGISIRNTDGSWENIPNISVPLWGTTYLPTIKSCIVLPNGKLLVLATNAGYSVNIYDRDTKTFTTINFPDNKYPQQIIYDTDRNFTWIIAHSGVSSYLFSYDGTSLNEITNLGSFSISTSNPISYTNNAIWLGNNLGLYKIDVSTYTTSVSVQEYSSTTTPSIPFDSVLDIKSDSNGFIWLANLSASDGALVKFNTTTDTYNLFQVINPNSTSNIRFNKLATDANSEHIWAVSNTYLGLVELNLTSETPNWSFLSGDDLEALNIPIIYVPNHVYFANNHYYFTTNSGSSSDDLSEVLIYNGINWLSRNDNESGNLSYNMTQRFQNSLPDKSGGVWWFNNSDNIIIHRDNNDYHQAISLSNFNFYNQAIDIDSKAIVKGGTPSKIRKIDFPDAVSIQSSDNAATDIKRFKNQIWVYDRNLSKIDIYEDELLTNTLDISDSDYSNFSRMAIDDDANPWFVKGSGTLQLKKFDVTTLTTTTYDRDENLGNIKALIPAPNNGIWIIGYYGIMYLEDGEFFPFLTADYSELNHIENAVVDTNGKLYILNNNTFAITTLENPTTTPTLGRIELEYTSILPSLGLNGSTTISLDGEGSLWTHSNRQSIKLVDDDLAFQYIQESTVGMFTHNASFEIKVYPNPTKGTVYLNTNLIIDSLEIYTVLGEKVMSNTNSKSISMNSLKQGVYILIIKSQNKTITKKIILN